jgi:hypothetical protein
MNFKKLILPMLAFICAVGVAFATVDLKPEPKMVMDDSYATMYVYTDGWHTVEVDCELGDQECKVIFSQDPSRTPYQVYNSPNFGDLAEGDGIAKIIQGPPPSNN